MSVPSSIWRGALIVPLRVVLQKTLDSFWFLPGLLVLASLGLAWITINAGAMPSIKAFIPLEPMTVAGARVVLATIAGAVMTVGGVVFSLTFVALSVSAQQLGPRIVLMVMRNRTTQFVLGIFTATFLHSLIALTAAGSRGETSDMPSLAVYFSVALATGSFCLVIYFVHAIALHIQADAVVAALAKQLKSAIHKIALADDDASEGQPQAPGQDAVRKAAGRVREQGEAVLSRHSGYVQTVDYVRVLTLAEDNGCEVAFAVAPGDFVLEGSPLGFVAGCTVDDELRVALCNQVGLGERRTAAEQIDFELRALVEVALRALSPSLNDPYTALACVHHLSDAIRLLLRRPMASSIHCGTRDDIRVYERSRSIEAIFEVVFQPLLLASAGSIVALRGMISVLSSLAELAETETQKRALGEHMSLAQGLLSEILDRQPA